MAEGKSKAEVLSELYERQAFEQRRRQSLQAELEKLEGWLEDTSRRIASIQQLPDSHVF